ncbi:hypothetical protein DdX_12560 [Ditylenchus destructor]|uniref:Uncharacterized protein n=1 Tax=Ditylenchus destructor TaxID=166010 RepID=A0AAD4R3C8_9BILA|nr:hypothetical protein DdX_12560 [Ditylenchus destructor]
MVWRLKDLRTSWGKLVPDKLWEGNFGAMLRNWRVEEIKVVKKCGKSRTEVTEHIPAPISGLIPDSKCLFSQTLQRSKKITPPAFRRMSLKSRSPLDLEIEAKIKEELYYARRALDTKFDMPSGDVFSWTKNEFFTEMQSNGSHVLQSPATFSTHTLDFCFIRLRKSLEPE